MTQNIIVIGDTHFGIKNNSMTWLKHQVGGFNEIIDYLEHSVQYFDVTTIIHMGDIFDSRSSINPLVFKEVSGLLTRINDILHEYDGDMYILGGNHDYYYPWESKRNYTGIQMLPYFDHIWSVTEESNNPWGLTLIPWFEFTNINTLGEILAGVPKDGYIFAHTDPYHFDPDTAKLMDGRNLITGHIHQPEYNPGKKLLVTGSVFPTDFKAANSKRGFWTLQREVEGGICKITKCTPPTVEFHEVKSSIHFHTLTEADLIHWQELGIMEDDYINIIIRQSNMEDHKDTIKELNDKFNTIITYVTEKIDGEVICQDALTVDVVCQKLLPDKLKSLYQNMVEAIEQKNKNMRAKS